jgi:acetyl-CoA/propionyl-CoA carboxylase biotin carboxyl carrier protein
MLHALEDVELAGIPTTIPFHRWLLSTPEFKAGTVHTKFVEQALAQGAMGPPTEDEGPGEEEAAGPQVRRPDRPVNLLVEVEGRRVPVRVWGDGLPQPPPPPAAMDHAAVGGGTLVAPMQGTILRVLVEPGQTVASGDTVCILEAMKMENHIASTRNGTVTAVAVEKGAVVETGQPLVVIE